MFHPGDTYSLDMDSGGLKYHSQFFVCKSGLFFFMGSIITSPNADAAFEAIDMMKHWGRNAAEGQMDVKVEIVI